MNLPALTAAQRKRLAELVSGTAPARARPTPGAKASPGRTCAATTKSGGRCKNAALEGSDRCRVHQRG